MAATAASSTPAQPAPAAAKASAWDALGRVVVRLVLAGTLALYVAGLPLAVAWWAQAPFVGALLAPGLALTEAGALSEPPLAAFEAGALPGDRLLAVNDVPVASPRQLRQALTVEAPGQPVALRLLRPGQGELTAHVTPGPVPAGLLVTYFGVPYGVGLAFIALGLLVYRLRRHEVAGRAFALFCAMAGLALGGWFDTLSSQWLAGAWALALPATGAAFFTLSLVFPRSLSVVLRRPGLRVAAFGPGLLLGAYALWALYGPTSEPAGAWARATAWGAAWLALGAAAWLVACGYRRASPQAPVVREQSQLLLAGGVLGLAPLAGWVAASRLTPGAWAFNPWLYLPLLALLPAAGAYSLLRYRVLAADYLITRALVYAGLAALTVVAYALLLTGASLLLGTAVSATHPLAVAGLVFGLVLALNPVRQRLEAAVDAAFFRGARAYRQRLEALGRALTQAATVDDIVRTLDEQLEGALRPAAAYLFLRGPGGNGLPGGSQLPGDEVAAHPVKAGHKAFSRSDLRFMADGPLAAYLAGERTALYLTPETPLPPALAPERARLALLGAAVYAPLPGQAGLAGWLAAGPRLSGEPYTADDLRFIEAVADQAALAVARTQVIDSLERRLRELDVLSQMSQAVNVTARYDDLLELISAQAGRVVEARNFAITLYDPHTDQLTHALYVEADERLPEREGRPWPAAQDLAGDVARTGQPIRTADYAAECRRRNRLPAHRGFRAWMGVPLNVGAQAVGVMSVASATPGESFTAEQQKIFAAVAGQAASALARAQLYQKAEQRARQLSLLNELSTSMATNLELGLLLERIVQSSMDMLACEAGSLFLTDEQTGEYEFRVAAGPVGQELVGTRLARGQGFVGEAIENARVLIVPDVQHDPRWYKGSDQTTGFATRALMVVPLQRGDRVIGALELINKSDGAAFDEEDRALLTAFAGQATVAIENARLFAQTDLALAERVEELSIMQRLDRELNETLDVERVMGVTLSYAMRQTGAYAGSVGMLSEAGITIIATQGYGDTVEDLRDRPLPLDRGIMGRVVRTGRMSWVRDVRQDPDYRGILPDTRCQLTIPILREGQVVGLIQLESPKRDAFSDEQVMFVRILLEHAAVAITNARLYAEVTRANIAKSEFVSTAAHELKTPMTAIKMSSELLLAGAVGAVNDTQRQFLGTIRNNLDRMSTIVSDLNDITRIETGRMRLDLKVFGLSEVMDEVLRSTRGLFDSKRQTLALEVPPSLPPVFGDHNRTAQVLTNLLSNAYKYTPDNGAVTLRVQVEGAHLHVAVQDTGIGISPEDQRRLFTKFFRAEDRAAREMATGTGLGLSIVRNLVELQGGRIWLESEFRKGSTFHFTLPLAPADAPAAPAQAPAP